MPDRLKNALPGGLPKYVDLAGQFKPRQARDFDSIETETKSKSEKLDASKDWRVRITLPPESKFAFRKKSPTSFMFPLQSQSDGEPDGVVFPQTPNITVTHNARYQEQSLTHSNYKSYFYEGSDVAAITVTGVFTCQNATEALYIQACIQFLRACTKMFFGKTGTESSMPSGTPPTLVKLSGYGDFYLPDVTCVITSVSHTMPDDCDYIKFQTLDGENYGWMPVMSTITVVLQPVVSRKRQAEEISLDKFVNAEYLRGKGGLL
jgi:hypothetical protein